MIGPCARTRACVCHVLLSSVVGRFEAKEVKISCCVIVVYSSLPGARCLGIWEYDQIPG